MLRHSRFASSLDHTLRKKKLLAKLLGRRRIGIVLSTHTDDNGATIFRQACHKGGDGIVSKRLSKPYR
jgi:ATP-dependent DNA ligase